MPQPIRALGVELVVINLIGLQLPLGFVFRAFHKNRETRRRAAYSLYRGSINIAGFCFGIAAGSCLFERSNWGMYLITVSFIAFLVSAVLNAWTIMSVVGQGETRR
jgi:energy-converting hydrogenase Eha subunit A